MQETHKNICLLKNPHFHKENGTQNLLLTPINVPLSTLSSPSHLEERGKKCASRHFNAQVSTFKVSPLVWCTLRRLSELFIKLI